VSGDFRIRAAVAADAPAIANLVALLQHAEGVRHDITAGYVAEFVEPDSEIAPGVPSSGALVAEAGDPAAGVVGVVSWVVCADLFHGGPSAMIKELVLDEAWRGHGIGGMLLDAALEHLDEEGCVEVAVTTGVDNDRARYVYRTHGFDYEGVLMERHQPE
jgi:GNAT superfamily N-acetyltransferase